MAWPIWLAIALPLVLIVSAWSALLLWHGQDLATEPAPFSALLHPGEARLLALLQAMCSTGLPWWSAFGENLAMAGLMVAAMMLPLATPAWRALLQDRDWRAAYGVLGGYALAWLGFAAVSAGAQTGMHLLQPSPADFGNATLAAGTALVLAGLYQFSAAKRSALHALRCSPQAEGKGGGFAYGWTCIKCDGPLMAVMALLGAMNLAAMLAFTAVMAAEKTAGRGMAATVGVLLVGLGSAALAAGQYL